MKTKLILPFSIFLIFISCDSSHEIFDSNTSEKTICFINEKGNIVKNCSTNNVVTHKQKYIIKTKQVVPDYYVPLVENGFKIEGASLKVSGVLFGVIDELGNEILPFQFESIVYSDDLFLVREVEKFNEDKEPTISKYGYKNKNNEWVLKPIYQNAKPFNNGLAVVQESESILKVINKKGHIIFSGLYEEIYPLSKELFIVKMNDEKCVLINKHKKILSDEFYLVGFSLNSVPLKKMVLVSKLQDFSKEDFGYLNQSGKIFWFSDYR